MIRIFLLALLALFFLSSLCSDSKSNDDFPFQKKVWSYWNQDLTKAPIFVQACYEKIKSAAQKAGFEYTLLNRANLPDYISDYGINVALVRQKSVQQGFPAFADLIRVNIIYEHGGIWMDITEILIHQFDWLLKIKTQKYRNLITNRFSEEPDALFFYNPNFQNSAEYRIPSKNNKNQTILYNQIPAFQAWFFAAKKKSALVKEIKQVYSNFTQIPYQKLFRLFIEQQIYMHNQDGIGYLTINYAISYVLQKKQKQLDRSISLFGERKNVYEFYKLWGLSSFLGPLSWTNDESADMIHLIDRPIQYFQKRGWMANFFIKIVGHLTKEFAQKLDLIKNIFSKSNFQQFLNSQPSQSQCEDTYFVVKGSFIDKLFQDTAHLQKNNIQVISQKENQEWQKYCLQNYGINKEQKRANFIVQIVNYLLFLKGRQAVPWYQAHKTVSYDKPDSENQFNDWLYASSASLGFWLKFFIDSAIWFVIHLSIYRYLSKKYIKNSFQSQFKENISQNIILSIAIILCNTISNYEYHMVDQFGQRDRPFQTLVSVIMIYVLQNFIEKKITNNKQLQICYDVIYPFICFRTTFIIFSLMRQNKNRLTFYSVIIGLFGSCLMKFYKRMNSQKPLGSWISKIIDKITNKNIHRKAAVTYLLLINILPNISYILATNNHYLVSFIPVFAFILIVIVFLYLFIVNLIRGETIDFLRMFLLGSLGSATFYMLPIRNQVIEYNYHRVLWTFLCITVYQSIYVQIGNDYLLGDKSSEKNLSVKSWLLKRKQQILVCFGLLSVQLIIGSFSWMFRIPFNEKLGYFEGLLLGFNNLLVAVYLHIKVTNNGQKKVPTKQTSVVDMNGFEEIEMEVQNE